MKILFAVLFFSLVLSRVDFLTIIDTVSNISLWLYLVPILGHFVIMLIKALRWQLLLNSLEIYCPYTQTLKAYTAGVALGMLTPGQLGDMGKVMLLDNAIGKRKQALVSSVTDRVWDLLGLVLVSAVCAFLLFFSHFTLAKFFSYGFILCIVGLCFFPWIYRSLQKIILSEVDTDISCLFVNWHWVLFLTVLSLCVQFFRWSVLAVAFKLPIFTTAASAMIGTLVALIPVSFGGLGTREATMAAMFSFNGLEPALGVSFSLLMFGCYLVGGFAGVIVLFGKTSKTNFSVG